MTCGLLMYLFPWLRWLFSRFALWIRAVFRCPKAGFRRRENTPNGTEGDPAVPKVWRSRPKPLWVRREVLRLKALMPENGCRKIAATFCYLYAHCGETVSKSFVARLVKSEAEAIVRLRRDLKNRVPRKVPKNLIWALDLTFLQAQGGNNRPVLGVIDHGSRACLALRELTSRRTVDILRVVLDLVDAFGRPRNLRTDNESIFTAWLFRASLWLLGIRHQRSAPFAPWQNGRIERLFRTLKERVRSGARDEVSIQLNQAELDLFRAWYNGIRPHQHLEGEIVPAEAWIGKRVRSSRGRYFSAWGGALTGFY